jgi:hypothetical protein
MMNEIIQKYFLGPLQSRWLALAVSPGRVEAWMQYWSFFFILGTGRTGTAFLASLLGTSPGAHVFHEPVFEDRLAHARAHYDQRAAARYLHEFRMKEMYVRMRHTPPGIYGEVNSTLRCHAAALRAAFPTATLLHLVRDGRAVVRSNMSRRTMTARNPFSMSLHPTKEDPWRERWPSMDRFARLCWHWQLENARLRATIGHTVQFERLIQSYEYFQTTILEPCKLHVDRHTWQIAAAVPVNSSAYYAIPPWAAWSPQLKNTFAEICGEEMARCGYHL